MMKLPRPDDHWSSGRGQYCNSSWRGCGRARYPSSRPPHPEWSSVSHLTASRTRCAKRRLERKPRLDEGLSQARILGRTAAGFAATTRSASAIPLRVVSIAAGNVVCLGLHSTSAPDTRQAAALGPRVSFEVANQGQRLAKSGVDQHLAVWPQLLGGQGIVFRVKKGVDGTDGPIARPFGPIALDFGAVRGRRGPGARGPEEQASQRGRSTSAPRPSRPAQGCAGTIASTGPPARSAEPRSVGPRGTGADHRRVHRRRVSPRWLFLEAFERDRFKVARHVRPLAARWYHFGRDDQLHGFDRGSAQKRRPACQCLVENGPERVDVGGRSYVTRASFGLFGGHEAGCAQHFTRKGACRVVIE